MDRYTRPLNADVLREWLKNEKDIVQVDDRELAKKLIRNGIIVDEAADMVVLNLHVSGEKEALRVVILYPDDDPEFIIINEDYCTIKNYMRKVLINYVENKF
jgi:hypothetical protein